ncbi:aminomethyl-transferring glycine dehydrogenase subunit GcvPB [Mechercharimyces sp. CAU 1602]|uniref:aminomethyl-transferring glycine dehydrogenase subunit GcvPB n=1 Tax=Mechercharimyces sp. CAU 1602 TaxID=2973933 RepID=UPI0021621521|nr:aminomethyl-transferring glycine dehydrogenase subunit GcvPB [Mechercharimyces sp. CAU 1602]MCS1350715.1 aminomethyl-transferring glycine dehydrogenase subunit GcvPB [Mechercharimyces sp. CAU 1602]
MNQEKALIFELSKPGRTAYSLPALDVPPVSSEEVLPTEMVRQAPADLPEVSELDLVRHYTELSRLNHGIDNGFYPLGSCTMKYNPKINEDVARLPGLTRIHPYQAEETVQGALELMYELQSSLAEITGMDKVTLQSAAGAQGEWVGLMLIRAYLQDRGESGRNKVIVPDSAHGTNPASAAVAGFETITVPSNEKGHVDVAALREAVGEDTAALMLTNPNTLGLFEEEIGEIADIVHEAGGLLYYDGANANAILGITRPGDMGFDVVHLNLHKTFTTPHGGGGPGSGPVGVTAKLAPYLPTPTVEKGEEGYFLNYDIPKSMGRIKGFYGNFGINVRAYAYIRTMGAKGLRKVSENAVLNANYMMRKLEPYYDLPFTQHCKHEFVLSGARQKKQGARTLDMAKRLLDFGVHPPTIYFPLIVDECLMIEPTETESKETLDTFIETMIRIAKEAEENPEVIQEAPHHTPVRRLDEVLAARKPVLRWEREKK